MFAVDIYLMTKHTTPDSFAEKLSYSVVVMGGFNLLKELVDLYVLDPLIKGIPFLSESIVLLDYTTIKR